MLYCIMEKHTRSVSVYSRTSSQRLAVLHKFVTAQGYIVRSKSDLIDIGLSILYNSIVKDNPTYVMSDFESALYVVENLDVEKKQVELALSLSSHSQVKEEEQSDLMEQFRKAQELLARGEQ